MACLENWCIVEDESDPFQAPELRWPLLQGNVYGSDKFPDGKLIAMGRPVSRQGDAVVTASGSVYELGAVDPRYEASFPGAKQRLLNSLDLLNGANNE